MFGAALPGEASPRVALRSCRTRRRVDESRSRACSLHLANQVRRVARASHRIESLVVVARPAIWEQVGVSRCASVERAVICSI